MDNTVDVLEKCLRDLGYRDSGGAVIRDYKFAVSDGQGCADLLAFADPRQHDISTACIAVQDWPNGHNKKAALRQLSYVGAPIALFTLPERVEIWSVQSDPSQITLEDGVSYQSLDTYFHKHARDLSPKSVLGAKRGGRQLSFFEVDPSLEFFARDATQKSLVRQFEETLAHIPPATREKYSDEFYRLSIWILAARILQDKLGDEYSDLKTRDIIPLLKSLQQHFPAYFQGLWEDFKIVGQSVVETLYYGLCGDFSFRSLTNDMLAYFYENTLVDEDLRKDLGIFYTPKFISERILHRLPLENLHPQERTVFDGSCGSGNLLLAAYDRLSDLLPVEWSSYKRHKYLLKHIYGLDKDAFACEIASLSLSLYNLPNGDSWQIKQGDLFEHNPQHLFGEMPHVIVGNPPFHEPRSTEGKRVQLAAEVLDRYLDWLPPQGLLGIVLPLTFLHTNSSTETRKKLLDTCEILEIWHLPEGTIPRSSVSVVVVLARKLNTTHSSISGPLVRVEENRIVDFSPSGQKIQPITSYVTTQHQWHSDQKSRMTSSPFEHIWSRIESQFPESEPEFCIIRNGVQPGKKARPTHFSPENEGKEWRPVLYNNKTGEILGPYLIRWDAQKIRYIKYPSSELQWARTPEHFDRPSKVVFNAVRNPDYRWRIFAAIDRSRLVVTENFNYILPKEGVTVEELASVFNSMLANAWFSSRSHNVKINLTTLKKMPFPNFTDGQREQVIALVQRIVEKKQSLLNADVEEIRKCIVKLDRIIFDAYGIAPCERKEIRNWMERFERPGKEWEDTDFGSQTLKAQPYQGRKWGLSGEVENVSYERRTISIWLQGRSDTKEIPIPPSMPGWALRPGVAFLAFIPWEQRYEEDLSKIRWLDFQPLDFGYLSDEELVNRLTKKNA
jgi:hypothetical protein